MRIVLTKDDRIGVLTEGGMVDVTSVFEDFPYRTAADRMPRVIGALGERRAAIDAMISGTQGAKLIKIEETGASLPERSAEPGSTSCRNTTSPCHSLTRTVALNIRGSFAESAVSS